MNCNLNISPKIGLLFVCFMVFCHQATVAQEEAPNLNTNNTYHNQLFFNRFLINPTFSLVRENKSYLNILHRNQYATFEDNSQNYFIGFSNKINERTALGIGVYSQWAGVIQEFGFNANYATSVRLGSKSKLTFGTNVTYFNEGLDKNRVIATENDPEILAAKKESKVAIQPGITLSVGAFDFGLYAEDLFKYNQTTNNFLTRLDDKSIKASLQYTHSFMAAAGLFKDARLMPLLQVGKNEDGSISYVGALLLDLPKYGWLQSTMDDQYGLSVGLGFNINKRMSLGYLLEKDILEKDADFGWNHELSLAYTFKNHGTGLGELADNSEDNKIDRIVRNYEEQILQLMAEKEQAQNQDKTKVNNTDDHKVLDKNNSEAEESALAYENRLVLDELILRQDSIEGARTAAFEQRFETIIRFLRKDIERTIKSNLDDFNNAQNTLLVADETTHEATKSINTAEHKEYVKLPIRVLNRSDITGVEPGYYLIANVYKNKRYLNAFINQLTEQGLNARQFYNRENGLYYVYLADFKMKEDAKTAVVSNLHGKYRDEKWIMQVASSTATVSNTYEYE